jgi:hypothetical protein
MRRALSPLARVVLDVLRVAPGTADELAVETKLPPGVVLAGAMSRPLVALVVLVLASCSPMPDRWTVDGEDHVGALAIAERVRELAPCDDVERNAPWGGRIAFVAEGGEIVCGTLPPRLVLGCASIDEDGAHVAVLVESDPSFTIARLVHELGHIAWSRCGLESRPHPWAFLYWSQRVTFALARPGDEARALLDRRAHPEARR